MALLVDGTAVNVGWRVGLHVHVERALQRKLLLLSCMLHGNELPLRHLFKSCDGGHGTTGPESFAGPLGAACKEDVHLLDLVTFSPIFSTMEEMPPAVWKDLSSDQKLLYRYVMAIWDGMVPPSLISLRCGPINHSRWLTLATRLLILYTRTPNPCDGLQTVVQFIVQVYAPLWFQIKKNNNFIYGPSAIFTAISLINQQPESVREVVRSVVQRNAWFAEVGIMLCSMLGSEERRVREKTVEVILKRRLKPLKEPRRGILQGIRKI